MTNNNEQEKAVTRHYTSEQLDNMGDPELLRLAVADTLAVEKDPKYELNMYDWVLQEEGDDRCQVCMAGAIIANRFPEFIIKGDREWVVIECGFVPEWALRIDKLRRGMIDNPRGSVEIKARDCFLDLIPKYPAGTNGWSYPPELYLEFADILEDLGL